MDISKKHWAIILHIIGLLPLIIIGIYFSYIIGFDQEITSVEYYLKAIFYILISIVFSLIITNFNSNFLIPINITSEIKERFDKIKQNINLADAGIIDFAKGASREEKYEKIASEAKKEILVSGIGFSQFVQDFDKVERLINKVEKFKILMLNPEILTTPNMENYLKKVTTKESVKYDVENNYGLIKEFQKKLYDEKKDLFNKLEFRIYDTIPTMTFYLTDINSTNSKMVIDLLPYSCAVQDRPMIILAPHKDDDLYHFLLGKFEKLWNESVEVTIE